jgi:hypothetical protein
MTVLLEMENLSDKLPAAAFLDGYSTPNSVMGLLAHSAITAPVALAPSFNALLVISLPRLTADPKAGGGSLS